jgi:hypothetical protein
MAKFLLLYQGGGMPESQEEAAAVLQQWQNWYDQLGKAVVDQGSPFTPMAKSINASGGVSDGPAGTMASGYTILEAGSLDEAARMAQSCPVLQSGAQISVFEAMNMMM